MRIISASLLVALVTYFLGYSLGYSRGIHRSEAKNGICGLPAGVDKLEDGGVYLVENFHLTSWGYLAQLKKIDADVSRQYRVTTIQEMEAGGLYKVQVSPDSNSALGVTARFQKLPKE